MTNLREIVEKAINEYNKYGFPEAEAKLISLQENIIIEFNGSFCYTCGFHDYFEDFTVILDEKGFKTAILGIKEFEGGAVVKLSYHLMKNQQFGGNSSYQVSAIQL